MTKLTPEMSIGDVVATMSEGNPGAISVMMRLLNSEDGIIDIMKLDVMGIRGGKIWVGLKDFAKGDLQFFKTQIRSESPEMKKFIETCYREGGNEPHIS